MVLPLFEMHVCLNNERSTFDVDIRTIASYLTKLVLQKFAFANNKLVIVRSVTITVWNFLFETHRVILGDLL